MGMKKISLFLCFFIAIAVNAQDTLKIWLALPFSADVSAKEMKSKKLHAPQKASIDYYTGALVALDSLQKSGKNIRLVVKDTRKDSATTVKMFRNFNSGEADIIIGPVTKKWFLNVNPIVAQKGALHISPILDYPKMNGLANSVFFETDVSGFGKSLAQYLFHKHGKDGHLILVHDGSPEDKIFSTDFMALKDSLSLDIQEIQLKNAADLPKLFQNSGINLLIFPAVKEAKVNQFFGQLRNAWKDSIQVWGLGGWHEMKNVDFDKWDRFQVALVMQSPYDFFMKMCFVSETVISNDLKMNLPI